MLESGVERTTGEDAAVERALRGRRTDAGPAGVV